METSSNRDHPKPEVSSAAVREDLLQASSIGSFLKRNQKNMHGTLTDFLNEQLRLKDLRERDVVRDSGQSKSYVNQILNGKKHPSRDILITLSFGLHLDLDDTQRMLKLGGHSELYPRVERDAVIFFAINNGKTVWETDELLFDNGFEPLSSKD